MRRVIALAALATLLLPVAATGQDRPTRAPAPLPLELRESEMPRPAKRPRPIVRPRIEAPDAVREAERAIAELDAARRQEELLREQARPVVRRPDLDHDVVQGIQQRAIQRALRR
ncbi:MAG: hypothetical protein HYV94_22780 [Candidatus Rokubacteria bacterium]|nr:hypothetical protein [Candidatus Rokubacteria bacterium]MBI2494907.1 hypothetical protein [Candidatus Rokubacteria bacterium]MBI4627431.1 hypothetical protein [Candidatus Rokubacteria bacterium]